MVPEVETLQNDTSAETPESTMDRTLREAMRAAGVEVPEATVEADKPKSETEKSSSPSRSKDGKFAKSDPVEVDTDEAETDLEDADDESDVELPDGAEEAIRALRRDNVPQSQIDRLLKESPDELVEWGQARAKQQATIDDKFKKHELTSQELAELRKQLKNAGLQTDAGTPPAAGDQPGNVPGPVQKQLDAMREGIEAYFGENDLADAIAAPFSSLAESLVSMFEDRLKRQESSLHAFLDASNRERAREKYPQLDDDDAYRRVLDRMAQIETTREYKSRHDLLLDAAKIEFAEEIAAEAAKERTNARKRRDLGTPKKATGGTANISTMTLAELSDAELRARMSGDHDKVEAIRRKIRQLT